MTEWDIIFERNWNKYSISKILERKKNNGDLRNKPRFF